MIPVKKPVSTWVDDPTFAEELQKDPLSEFKGLKVQSYLRLYRVATS